MGFPVFFMSRYGGTANSRGFRQILERFGIAAAKRPFIYERSVRRRALQAAFGRMFRIDIRICRRIVFRRTYNIIMNIEELLIF